MDWINVDKSVPNFNFEVIICDSYGEVGSGYRTINDKGYVYWSDHDDNEMEGVRYWMKLPFPPLKEIDDSDSSNGANS